MAREARKGIVIIILLTVTVLQLTSCLDSNSNWWLNIHLNQVKETCDEKGTTVFDDLLQSHQRFREISKIKYAEIETEFWRSHSNITLKYMLHQKCYNDQRIKTAILNVTNNVQNCFKREERLKKSSKKMVMKKILDAVCSMMELYLFFNAETECEEILRKDAGFNKCYDKFPNVWPSHNFWPIPFTYPDQVCNERMGLKECHMEIVKDCIPFTWYTQASFNSLLSKVWSSIFCKNML